MDTPFSQERPQDDHAATGRLRLPRNADWDDDVYALGAVAIAKISISEKPGWLDDGLYLCDIPEWGGSFSDEIKVRTKRGAARKEPIGCMRYPQDWGKYVKRMKITELPAKE